MDHDDLEIEALLRQVRPRAPRSLPPEMPGLERRLDLRRVTRGGGWLALGAAAAAAMFAANLRFMPMAGLESETQPGSALTIAAMRGLVDADPATLDRALLEASKSVLPDVEAPDSALGQFTRP
jgi:hypothetical protein